MARFSSPALRTDLPLLRRLVGLALQALGALPGDAGRDPTRLLLLARRQATALAWGRRRQLSRLACRLGAEPAEAPLTEVPERLLRPYPLMGWAPVLPEERTIPA